MAANDSAGGTGFTSAGCLESDLYVNGGTEGAPAEPETPSAPDGNTESEEDGAANLAGYGAIAVAALGGGRRRCFFSSWSVGLGHDVQRC